MKGGEIDSIFSAKKQAVKAMKAKPSDTTAAKGGSSMINGSTHKTKARAIGTANGKDSKAQPGNATAKGLLGKNPASLAVEVVDFSETSKKKHSGVAVSRQEMDGKDDDDDFADSRGTRSKRRKIDGLDLYSAEELNIGKGGDTEDCPFDCKCCF
ncbi:MAG: hypothetical protein SGCHY_001184 [Lobulomycetales sp.]